MSASPPESTEAEIALLGAILIDPSVLRSVQDILKPADFFVERYRWVYEAAQGLHTRGKAVDIITVAAELERSSRLEDVGGHGSLTRLVASTPSTANAQDYAKIVKDSAQQRWAIDLASDIAKHSTRPKRLGEILSRASSQFDARRNIKSLDFLAADEILTREWPEQNWAVPKMLPAGLTILAGKAKVGKSWLALQLAQAVAAGGIVLGERVEERPILYLALEDPPRRLRDRMVKQRWQEGLTADFLTVGGFYNRIGDLRDGGGGRIASAITERGYGLVTIDTLSRAIVGDQNDMDVMTRALEPAQLAAHSQNCAVLLIDHHRKGRMGNPDAIADILGSTAKGAMADCIWGLYRETGKAGAKLQIVGRDVEERSLDLSFDAQTGSWISEGETNSLALTDRRMEILDILEEIGPCSFSELAKAISGNKGKTYQRVQDLVTAGLVDCSGRGRGAEYDVAKSG